VTNDTGDRAWRSPLALPAQAVLGSPCKAVAAVGAYHGEAGQTGLAAGLPPYGARPITSAPQKRGLCSQEDGPGDGRPAPSQGPAGAPRTCRLAPVTLGRPIRSEATATGTTCPRQQQCMRNPGGRRLPRWVEEPRGEALEPRGRRRPAGMQQRKQRVAHPGGTRQSGWDAGYCCRRGLEQVRTECRLTVLASNRRGGGTLARGRGYGPLWATLGWGAVWSCGQPLPRQRGAEFLGRRAGAGNSISSSAGGLTQSGTAADANSLRSCLATAAGAAHRQRSSLYTSHKRAFNQLFMTNRTLR